MNLRKIQTTVHANGQVRKMDLGTVDLTNLERDRASELRRLSKIAMHGDVGRIQSIEPTASSIVVIYVDGTVRVVNWVEQA